MFRTTEEAREFFEVELSRAESTVINAYYLGVLFGLKVTESTSGGKEQWPNKGE